MIGHGLVVVAAGIAVGLFGSLMLDGVLAAFVFRTDPADPRILFSATAALGIVALAAPAVPAFRATRVPPRATLAAE